MLHAAVMRCRVLVGITLLLWVYVLVGGAVFHLLESKHEDETINDTLDAFYDLLRKCKSWWRHHIKTFSTLLAFCVGNAPVTGEFRPQRPVTRRFHVFLDMRLNQQWVKNGPWISSSCKTSTIAPYAFSVKAANVMNLLGTLGISKLQHN